MYRCCEWVHLCVVQKGTGKAGIQNTLHSSVKDNRSSTWEIRISLCVCVCVCVCGVWRAVGLFCELSPPMVLPRTSPCDHYDCANGAQCVVKDTDPVCQCLHGYEGMQCEKLVSVNFINRESFLQIPSNLITEQANISLQVHHTYTDHSARVREIKLILHQLCIYTYVCVLYACSRLPQMRIMGVLLYKGDNEHIAVELYRGRLRVSYDSGSYPPSAIYRYTNVYTGVILQHFYSTKNGLSNHNLELELSILQ